MHVVVDAKKVESLSHIKRQLKLPRYAHGATFMHFQPHASTHLRYDPDGDVPIMPPDTSGEAPISQPNAYEGVSGDSPAAPLQGGGEGRETISSGRGEAQSVLGRGY